MITFFLGSNPALSAQEIISYLQRNGIGYTVEHGIRGLLRVSTSEKISPEIIKDLGGTIRITEDIHSWDHIPSADEILDALSPLPGKWVVGIGSVGVSQNMKKMGIELKKAAKARSSRISFIEPRAGSLSYILNAAQVIFHNLTKSPNTEIIIQNVDDEYILTKTIAIQDITAYELRDTSRPARDARVGMLPPKLAQIMINVALPERVSADHIIYDPFCGMGTILQEAYLMGMKAYGSDASQRMVEYSQKNLDHVEHHFPVDTHVRPEVFIHDVQEKNIPHIPSTTSITIVTEPYLGAPQTHPLSPASAAGRPTEVDLFYKPLLPLYRTFFVNMRSLLQPGARLLVLLPAVRVRDSQHEQFTPIDRRFLDEIASLGYRKHQLIPQEEVTLYARPDALVARELTLWEVA